MLSILPFPCLSAYFISRTNNDIQIKFNIGDLYQKLILIIFSYSHLGLKNGLYMKLKSFVVAMDI
jgi:hypothetical protein